MISQGETLRQAIYGELKQIIPTEASLERGYARLGGLLAAFKSCEGWRGLNGADGQPYPNFDAFMLELRERYNRGRTQLYQFCSVAEKLLPMISADTLDEMGISKATEIKRAIGGVPGRAVTPEILEAARNPKVTIKQLRAILADAFNITDERPAGQWFDFGGAYLTPDERKAFVDAVKVTTAILGLKNDVPDHIQRKEIFLAWAAEFEGTHAAEVYGTNENL
jgi:hypothetical protein